MRGNWFNVAPSFSVPASGANLAPQIICNKKTGIILTTGSLLFYSSSAIAGSISLIQYGVGLRLHSNNLDLVAK